MKLYACTVTNLHATNYKLASHNYKRYVYYSLVVRDTADKDGSSCASCQYFGGVLSPRWERVNTTTATFQTERGWQFELQ